MASHLSPTPRVRQLDSPAARADARNRKAAHAVTSAARAPVKGATPCDRRGGGRAHMDARDTRARTCAGRGPGEGERSRTQPARAAEGDGSTQGYFGGLF
eukprot:8592510-Alexandrium_andersonii.AAC.1